MTPPLPEEGPSGHRRLQDNRNESRDDDPLAAREAKLAAAEAGAIGGRVSDEQRIGKNWDDEAMRPLREAGEGESEGFELAEEELIEHASHGDQHAARRILEDAPESSDDSRASGGGEADEEERPDLG